MTQEEIFYRAAQLRNEFYGCVNEIHALTELAGELGHSPYLSALLTLAEMKQMRAVVYKLALDELIEVQEIHHA